MIKHLYTNTLTSFIYSLNKYVLIVNTVRGTEDIFKKPNKFSVTIEPIFSQRKIGKDHINTCIIIMLGGDRCCAEKSCTVMGELSVLQGSQGRRHLNRPERNEG